MAVRLWSQTSCKLWSWLVLFSVSRTESMPLYPYYVWRSSLSHRKIWAQSMTTYKFIGKFIHSLISVIILFWYVMDIAGTTVASPLDSLKLFWWDDGWELKSVLMLPIDIMWIVLITIAFITDTTDTTWLMSIICPFNECYIQQEASWEHWGRIALDIHVPGMWVRALWMMHKIVQWNWSSVVHIIICEVFEAPNGKGSP